ncbi:MAG: glycosyltransferase family 2 protein [Caldilineaceae bacterium]
MSIVTPSFNQGEFLEETIRSVLLQGYPALEYLIVDGGSTDQSVDVICRYESRLAHWVSEPDSGQADAINKGFSRATGEIIAWLNSDDTYEPDAIVTAVAYLLANPHVGAVYSDCHYIDLNSKRCGRYRADDCSIEGQYLCRNGIPQPSVFMRADVYHRAGALDPRFRFILDYELWLRMIELAPLVRLPNTLANYRLWSDSHTVARPDQFLQEKLALFDELANDPELPAAQRALARKAVAATRLKVAKVLADRGEWGPAFDEIERAKVLMPPREWTQPLRERMGSILSRRGKHRMQDGDFLRGAVDVAHGALVSPRLVPLKLVGYLRGKRGKSSSSPVPTDPCR